MRAVVWDGATARLVKDAPDPLLRPDTAIIRVRYAGICSTDLQILRGYMQFRGIPGHELVGVVEQGPGDLRGRRVVAEINFACGRCASCTSGRGRHCPARTVMGILGADGAFAERVRVPLVNLRPVPDDLDDLAAVFTEPLAAAYRAAEQTNGFAGGRTTVIGAGKLGLLVAQVLAGRGDSVEVVYRSEASRARLAVLGLRAVPRDCAQRGADLVVEASGSAEGLRMALDLVRPLGAVVFKSTIAGEHRLSLANLVVDEIALIGSRCGPFEPALAALAAGRVEVRSLMSSIEPLDRAVQALERAGRSGEGKIVLEP